MKNLLLDTLVEVVGYRTDKHSLRKPGNLTRWNERVHLRVDGGGHVLPVDGNGLPLLQHLTKPLGERLCRFPDHLTGEDVTDRIHHNFGFLIAIVAHQLTEILKTQTHGNLVASGGGYKVVQPLEVYRGQLVDDDR